MRIGCLQFAPLVGDIDNNLNRADAVLNKANEEDLDALDLLVLPELAFTGYNFKSLQQISPFLEPSGSGISSLWARTIALKYNTTVVVGYPEKVDPSTKWPTSPEYYNSAIVVNGDGETIANYRKSFLYQIDETWALEGKDGFFEGFIPGLGHTALGICMDLNPYRFEAPWHAFEFAFHVLEMEANLVIVTMAWLTREDGRMFSRMPQEPDMETLAYWMQRLEPLIRAESSDEVIVVFCNRTGVEEDSVYAGTSAVLGIRDGVVALYGLLGRGVKELLVVDTEKAPCVKLVNRPEGEGSEVSSQKPPESNAPGGGKPAKPQDEPASSSSKSSPTPSSTSPQDSSGEPKKRKQRPISPKIQIPVRRQQSISAVIDESPTIPTPTAPSPTPLAMRPKLLIPAPGIWPTKEHSASPFPHEASSPEHVRIYDGSVLVSHDQVTPLSEDAEPLSAKFFVPSSTLLQSPTEPGSGWPSMRPEASRPKSSIDPRVLDDCTGHATKALTTELKYIRSVSSERSSHSSKSGRSRARERTTDTNEDKTSESNGVHPLRPSSPKSRNASRSGRPQDRRMSGVEQPDLDAIAQRLEALRNRPESAMDGGEYTRRYGAFPDRPSSPKSRNASRTGFPLNEQQPANDRAFNLSRNSIPIAASPSIFPGLPDRPQTDILNRSNSQLNQTHAFDAGALPASENERQGRSMSMPRPDRPPSRALGDMLPSGNMPNMPSMPTAHIEPDETRTVLWSEVTKFVGDVMERQDSGFSSRGRRRPSDLSAKQSPSDGTHPTTRRVESLRRQSSQRGSPGDGVSPDRHSQGPHGPNRSIVQGDFIAEITMITPGCPVHQSRHHRDTPPVGTPRSNASAPRNGPSPQGRGNSQGEAMAQTPPTEAHVPPLARANSNFPRGEVEKRLASHAGKNGNATTLKRRPLESEASSDSIDSCPTISGSSIKTLATPNDSPATPPQRSFEPTTPKAMNLPDLESALSSASSDPTASGNFGLLRAFGNDLKPLKLERPRSAVW